MLLKEATVFLLLLGLFHCDASEKGEKFKDFPDESLNSLEERDFNFKQKKNFKSSEEWSDDKYRELREKARHEAEKDYKYLEEKNRRRNSYDNDRFIKSKEFGSNNYIDKYNKYGKSFNLNHIDKSYKKNKGNYQEKHFLSADKLQSFKSDVDDYHMKNNEKINKDYKLISKSTSKPNSLISDMDINYIEDKKNIDKDSEWIEASKLNLKKSKENYQNNYQNKNEKYIKRDKKKFYQNLKEINLSGPPKNDTVLMARYIVHSVDWASMATISNRNPTKGAPFVCAKAISDGMTNSSTGVPFLYLSQLDLCTQDLQKNSRVSILATLAQTEYCKNSNLDPQDPRCAKMTLSGEIKHIKSGSEEEKFAKEALFSRHPAMATWPSDHNWYFAKLKITEIVLLDKFGGATYVDVKEYLNSGRPASQK